jgi:2-polyprenyl-3-methyl-5-hydroxy-6-metoxy-1,4-benzoquinol methylase
MPSVHHYTTSTVRHRDDPARACGPEYYVKGKDWTAGCPPEQVAICREHGIEVVVSRHRLDSSSRLLTRSHQTAKPTMNITEFEQRVLDQKPVGPTTTIAEYFTGEWRTEGTTTASRRGADRSEEPALIKEVFQPQRCSISGAAPGALMHLLWELGVDVEGIDFAESSKQLATPEVRDRITVGYVGGSGAQAGEAYDLVICREVLEHLTVLQVKQAVANMVRMTSKFIYVTTRFHPSPETCSTSRQQVDVDPDAHHAPQQGHAAADVRARGLRSRPDLEARMDWGNKGACSSREAD